MDASVNRIPSSADERTLLVSLKRPDDRPDDITYSLEELKMLVITAGGIVAGTRIIRRDSIDPAYIVGKGNRDTLKEHVENEKIKLVVFDINNIKPAQVRNLEEYLGCRVVGRTEVIMDIFARRARSAESKIQVELAQLRYILPRLKGLGGVLSRLGGGIGTRGPGEKMLETDRRHIEHRIARLKERLSGYEAHRRRTRSSRKDTITGAVVGYTNAGKSTLINVLARDDLFVEDRLFATLDSYTRKVYLSAEYKTLLTDTVGFIRNLPASLIESFRSTLEEIQDADYLIHVIDINAPDMEGCIDTVNSELEKLNCMNKPMILFFNKCDLAGDELKNSVLIRYKDAITGSAGAGEGLSCLKEHIIKLFPNMT